VRNDIFLTWELLSRYWKPWRWAQTDRGATWNVESADWIESWRFGVFTRSLHWPGSEVLSNREFLGNSETT